MPKGTHEEKGVAQSSKQYGLAISKSLKTLWDGGLVAQRSRVKILVVVCEGFWPFYGVIE